MIETPDRLDTLLRAARRGSRTAYSRFLAEAADRLRAFFARRIGADAELEDLVQECLIALHEKRATLDPGRPVGPWMYAIARYKLADKWRQRSRLAAPAVTAEPIGDEAAHAERDVAGLIDHLPTGQADAIRLTKLEGLSVSEAGERLGIGPSALKVRVHRGMMRLQRLAEEESNENRSSD